MKRPAIEMRRNIGIISHIDAGKTTTTERMLFYSGAVHRIGEVDEGSATMDWMSQERERGITITSAAITTTWADHEITIIDTPGHVDFTIEVERSLRVLDGAIAIFSAVEGVEPQSEAVWRQADKFGVPRLAFINKLDRLGADFERTIEMMIEKLGARPVLVHWPDGEGEGYTGQVEALSGDFLTWEGGEHRRSEPTGELKEKAKELRETLIEAVAEHDESVMEAYLEGGAIDAEALKAGLRRAVLAGELVPVFCGSSLKNKGVQPLLDAVVDYLPSPVDAPPAIGFAPDEDEPITRPPAEDAPFSALVFKVQIDGGRRLTYLRVYSGSARVGESLWNPARGDSERFARLFRMYSHKRERIDVVGPGDIVAAAGLKEAMTGDTLCSQKESIAFESILGPQPVISVAIEPRDATGTRKLSETLAKLQAEDPTFQVRVDSESGQTVMSGMGELHLEVLTRRIDEDFGVDVRVGAPRVVYRETLAKEADAESIFDRELAGDPQYARVRVGVAPRPSGGVSCTSAVDDPRIPGNLIIAALESLQASTSSGAMAGYEMTDVGVTLLEVDYDADRATEAAFSIAAANAFTEACRMAGGQLLEPVMSVEVMAPGEFLGGIIGDINARDGKVSGVEERGGAAPVSVVRASVPLAKVFGYATSLRSATQGRATYTMRFSHYAPCEMAGV
ncbi:MAG: elongation factor G [Nitrospinae bacterium]|nr:elongation factor G [Nitrospinota bacterium]